MPLWALRTLNKWMSIQKILAMWIYFQSFPCFACLSNVLCFCFLFESNWKRTGRNNGPNIAEQSTIHLPFFFSHGLNRRWKGKLWVVNVLGTWGSGKPVAQIQNILKSLFNNVNEKSVRLAAEQFASHTQIGVLSLSCFVLLFFLVDHFVLLIFRRMHPFIMAIESVCCDRSTYNRFLSQVNPIVTYLSIVALTRTALSLAKIQFL